MEHESDEPQALEAPDAAAFDAALNTSACPEHGRRDGWTPFARRLFLEVLAETGRVSRACDYAGLSVSSAYALRHRDALFAAGWDAACELARTALADALHERALDGSIETITRGGEVVATRHRHDSRLSIAVLHRLDKRCDLARDRGERHIRLVEKWDEWLGHVGRGAEAEAAAVLAPACSASSPDLQLPQLPESANPIEGDEGDMSDGCDEDGRSNCQDRCWQTGDGVWKTDFAPPQGFDGYEKGSWGRSGYERHCTAEEAMLLETCNAAADAQERGRDESLRDSWFALLKEEVQESAADAGGAGPGQ